MAQPRTRPSLAATFVLALLATWALTPAPASAWFLSPDSANTPGAGEATVLYWIALVVVVLFAALINLALLRALRTYRAQRGRAPRPTVEQPRSQMRVGGALAAFAAVMLVLGVIFTERSVNVEAAGGDTDTVRIKATGQQWLWRYDYPNEAYSYYRLTVPVDTDVTLDVVSTDVVHSWYVPQIGGKIDAVPGKLNQITFRAEEEGVYPGGSAIFSGQAYAAMRTEVVVVSKEEYEDFVEQRLTETQEAQDSAARAYNERQATDSQ